MNKRDHLPIPDSGDQPAASELQQDVSVVSALTADETPIPKAEEIFYEVMTSSVSVPPVGQHLRIIKDRSGDRWECLNCGCWAQDLQCVCGYHELALLQLSEEDEEKLRELERQLYWTCQCGFNRNTNNVDECRNCRKPNVQLREIQEKKQKMQIDANKSAFEKLCSCF